MRTDQQCHAVRAWLPRFPYRGPVLRPPARRGGRLGVRMHRLQQNGESQHRRRPGGAQQRRAASLDAGGLAWRASGFPGRKAWPGWPPSSLAFLAGKCMLPLAHPTSAGFLLGGRPVLPHPVLPPQHRVRYLQPKLVRHDAVHAVIWLLRSAWHAHVCSVTQTSSPAAALPRLLHTGLASPVAAPPPRPRPRPQHTHTHAIPRQPTHTRPPPPHPPLRGRWASEDACCAAGAAHTEGCSEALPCWVADAWWATLVVCVWVDMRSAQKAGAES